MRRLAGMLALVASLVTAGTAHAGTGAYLWATINSCDNASRSFGIRASMPGNGTSQRMYMHFRAQYKRADGSWGDTGSSSRWIRVGSARRKSVQSGFDFDFAEPPAGTAYTLRGKVEMRWRRHTKHGWRVVRRATRVTRAGVEGVEGGTPPGRSDAVCVIQR